VSWTHARAQVASLSRSREADDPDLLKAKQELRISRAEDYIRKIVAEAPPLTAEQKARLSILLSAEKVA
jgi:hypothetical protein